MAGNWNGFCGLSAFALFLIAGISGAVFAANSSQDSNATIANYWSPNATCGWYGLQCCANKTCYAGLDCGTGACLLKLPPEADNSTCGKPGQLCCGGNACYAGLVCGGGLCQLKGQYNGTVCGWYGAQCCGGGVCYTGTFCTAGGICAPKISPAGNATACGSGGNACCPGNSCQSGFECRSGTCQKYAATAADSGNAGRKIMLYTSAQPSAYGQAYPVAATGIYGAKLSISARSAPGYIFEEWSGNCPISDIYEKYSLATLATQEAACKFIARFAKAEEQCGSAGKQCCAGGACQGNLACSSNICQAKAPQADSANAAPQGKPSAAADSTVSSGGSAKIAPQKPAPANNTAAVAKSGIPAANSSAAAPSAAPTVARTGILAANNSTPLASPPPKCSIGQTGCMCGYTPAPCGPSTYCDTSSQFCLPACAYGVTTGSCMCMPQGAGTPYVLWWGVCGAPSAPLCGAANQSCCVGNACNSGYVCQSGTCRTPAAPPANNSTVCGGAGQACCTTGAACADSGYTCQSGTCSVYVPPVNNSASFRCTTGQGNCTCGYNPSPCGATTYCDTSSQLCLPACQLGVTTGNCMCLAPGSAPRVLWWGVCGTPAAPTCGAANQSCCNGITCNSGLGCASGRCTPKCTTGQTDCACGYTPPCGAGTYCDASSQLCLPACEYGVMSTGCICMPQGAGAPRVIWWGVCGTASCGAANQSCCAGTACNAGYTCQSGTCRAYVPPANNSTTCGGAGQACCATGMACSASGYTCQSGTCRVYTPPTAGCGNAGQLCCGGTTCNAGMTCGGGLCQYSQYFNNSICGWYGVQCCGGDVCYSGYQCDHGTCLIQLPPETDSATCGKAGQLCCSGTTCYSNRVCGGGLCQWREYYNSSICGWWGWQCCGGGVCYTGTVCTNGVCLPGTASSCGGGDMPCCSGSACNAGYTCQLGTCKAYVPPVNNSSQIITLYTESLPGGNGRTYPITTTGVYGSLKNIEAVPGVGYDFEEWNGNCPISDIYERVTTIYLIPDQGTYCRAVAHFPAGGTFCGASGKPCCAESTCNPGLACNVTGNVCLPAANVTLSPDLVVIEIDIPSAVQVGVRAYGSIRTTNVGNAPAQNSTTSYYIDSLMVNSADVPELPAGGANIAIASFVCQHAGTYTFMARADSGGAIVEANETNNEQETTFICVN